MWLLYSIAVDWKQKYMHTYMQPSSAPTCSIAFLFFAARERARLSESSVPHKNSQVYRACLMLSRSSWRAARVLRAARTGGGQQQQQSQPPAPASSTADTRTKIPAVAAACTCSRTGQKRRFSATERFRELDEVGSVHLFGPTHTLIVIICMHFVALPDQAYF